MEIPEPKAQEEAVEEPAVAEEESAPSDEEKK